MAKRITQLPAGTPADNDVVPYVDLVSGETKKALKSELKGDTGDPATVDVGTVTTSDPGTDAIVTNSGTPSAAVLDFTIPRGNPGVQGVQGEEGMNWQGAYSGATAYVVDDVVSYNGSSYICIQNTTGNAPTNATYWSLVAQKGQDGLGVGDMLAATYDPTNRQEDVFALLDSKEKYHGIESVGTMLFDNTTHLFTLSAVTYWIQGVKYTTASPVTCDLDLVADRDDNTAATLTAGNIYFIYFKDATGKLYWSDVPWNYLTMTFVATIFWNGSAGSVMKETHGHTRDLDWHIWAHKTVGTRYEAGLALTLPTTTTDVSLQIEAGTIHDEDIEHSIGQQTSMRAWYKTDSDSWTFADFSLPYTGTAGAPTFLDTDTYTLSTFANGDYVNYWVYASNDKDRPIWVIPSHVAAAYTTVANARAGLPPDVSTLPSNAEMKLIYRFIYTGNGQFQESIDYRQTSPLPGGGSASTTAGAVSYSPGGDIAATTVQTAIEELDTEKLSKKLVALSADGTYSGLTEAGTAGDALSFGHLCYFQASDSRWEKVDANLSAGYDKLLAICVLAAAGDGSATEMLYLGKVRADSLFPTLTIGAPVYMSETAGEITMTPPTTPDACRRIIGYAKTADELIFNPSKDYIIYQA